jgi:hypothetical protein
MSNIAISEILGHMETMKERIQARTVDAERSIERYVRDRVLCEEMIRDKKIIIADGNEAVRWLDATIDEMGRS